MGKRWWNNHSRRIKGGRKIPVQGHFKDIAGRREGIQETVSDKWVEELNENIYSNRKMGIENVGCACYDEIFTESEMNQRLEQFDDIPLDELESKATDSTMLYDLYRRRIELLGIKPIKLKNTKKWVQLVFYLKSLQNNLNEEYNSYYFDQIQKLIPAARKEGEIPAKWLEAVELNTEFYQEGSIDASGFTRGKACVMAEGPEEITILLKNKDEVSKKGLRNAGKGLRKEVYRGGYEELFEEILNSNKRIEYLREIVDEKDFYY